MANVKISPTPYEGAKWSVLAGVSIASVAAGAMILSAGPAAAVGTFQIGKIYDDMITRVDTSDARFTEDPAGISSPSGAQAGALVRGIREEDIKRLPEIEGHVVAGSLDGFDQDDSILLGKNMATKLGIGIGGTVSLLIANGAQTPFGIVPHLKFFKVKAIFAASADDRDNFIVYIPLQRAQAFFNKGNPH
ncbi:hypothetical protein [Methylovirgula sp. 4M-Z18]|uniref:hypothetical protein n=1 Tax=Methylovirgula sp. 4M-Z18 TaxID=2293567 RepID=UPI000E2EADE1|nr:hypothetical protein [Methylovirgula sp. 4M-Z18]RFB80950.1 hypothetical protein DYH55_05620 [Methylovirgula sp. 4M-Z18]